MAFEITINGKTERFETAAQLAEYHERKRPLRKKKRFKNKNKKESNTSPKSVE